MSTSNIGSNRPTGLQPAHSSQPTSDRTQPDLSALSGSPEGVIAQVSLMLEEQGDTARTNARQIRQQQRQLQREQISEQRSSALAEAVGQVLKSGAKIIATTVSDEGWSQAITSTGEIGGAGANIVSSNHELAAKAMKIQADEYGEAADSAESSEEAASRMQSRALSHLDEIAQARAAARREIVRG